MQSAGDGLEIDVAHPDGHASLVIHGEIDVASAPAFGAAIDQVLRDCANGRLGLRWRDVHGFVRAQRPGVGDRTRSP